MTEPTDRSYWLDLFTGATWDEFLKAGGDSSGFREHRWKTVQRMKSGDYLLCYLTGVSRFIGVLEVTSDAYRDETTIWAEEVFPSRVKVKPIVTLTPATAVPVHDLRGRLSFYREGDNPRAWTGRFRGSPSRWSRPDGEVVVAALEDAKANPVERHVDRAKLRRPVARRSSKIGPVVIPDDQDVPKEDEVTATPVTIESTREPTEHTEIQWLLMKLGSDMGLDVWVARNDRNRDYDGHRFGDLPRIRHDLPRYLDDATTRTVAMIDVLWLRGNTIVSAFEVESTTSVYSGLLRLGDLIALQPHLTIPLFIVAPDDRHDKVMAEVNRPTFRRLDPPMAEVTRLISFSMLRTQVKQVAPFAHRLSPEFLEDISEPCAMDEA